MQIVQAEEIIAADSCWARRQGAREPSGLVSHGGPRGSLQGVPYTFPYTGSVRRLVTPQQVTNCSQTA